MRHIVANFTSSCMKFKLLVSLPYVLQIKLLELSHHLYLKQVVVSVCRKISDVSHLVGCDMTFPCMTPYSMDMGA